MPTCVSTPDDRRRPFWTWQPDGCGIESNDCDGDCGVPGLKLLDASCLDNCGHPQCNGGTPTAKTLATNDYVRSLILGSLLTRGRRRDVRCGRRPGEGLGYWGDSLRRDSVATGSRLYDGPPSAGRTSETISWLRAAVAADLAYLSADGLVSSIKVSVAYTGGGLFEITIAWAGQAGDGVVGIAGGRIGKSWNWNGAPAA